MMISRSIRKFSKQKKLTLTGVIIIVHVIYVTMCGTAKICTSFAFLHLSSLYFITLQEKQKLSATLLNSVDFKKNRQKLSNFRRPDEANET
jgi:hypothetical protein